MTHALDFSSTESAWRCLGGPVRADIRQGAYSGRAKKGLYSDAEQEYLKS